MIGLFDSVFTALGKGFEVWDYYNRTRYARDLRSILTDIAKENAKPIYQSEDGGEVRDQSKIDNLNLKLNILVKAFNNEKGLTNVHKD